MNQIPDYSWISGSLMGITSIIGAIVAMVVMFRDYNKRKVLEAKEKSVGAEALKKIEDEINEIDRKVDNLTEQVDELKKDVRHNATEYLATLKELANRSNRQR